MSSDLGRHVEQLHAYDALGIDGILIHNVTSNQRAFIKAFGRNVLPQLRNS